MTPSLLDGQTAEITLASETLTERLMDLLEANKFIRIAGDELDRETLTAWRLLHAASQASTEEVETYQPSSTPEPGDPRGTSVELRFRQLLPLANSVVFEDGLISSYAAELHRLIAAFGSAAVEIIDHYIRASMLSINAASETLIRLGDIQRSLALDARIDVLGNALLSPHPMIRDAATVGLAALVDRRSLAHVERALEKEDIPQIRESLEWIRDQLAGVSK